MLPIHDFISGPAPIRVGGLSVTDKQIVAQHPNGATRVFEADEITAASDWMDEQDQREGR